MCSSCAPHVRLQPRSWLRQGAATRARASPHTAFFGLSPTFLSERRGCRRIFSTGMTAFVRPGYLFPPIGQPYGDWFCFLFPPHTCASDRQVPSTAPLVDIKRESTTSRCIGTPKKPNIASRRRQQPSKDDRPRRVFRNWLEHCPLTLRYLVSTSIHPILAVSLNQSSLPAQLLVQATTLPPTWSVRQSSPRSGCSSWQPRLLP